MRRQLPIVAALVAAFYGGLALYWVLAVRPGFPILGLAWPAAALVSLAVAFILRHPRLGSRRAQAFASTTLAVTVATASGLLVLSTGNPAFMVAPILAVVGFALILASRTALMAMMAVALAFLALSALAWPGLPWVPQGIPLVAACIIAALAQAVRLRLYDRMEAHHEAQRVAEAAAHKEERRRQELETVTRYVRLAAHQLATPLTSVTIQARRIAKADLGDEGLRRAAQLLDRNVARLNGVVADLMALTQHESGALPLRRAAVDMRELLQAAVEAHAGGPLGEVPVKVAAAPEGCVMEGDAERITLALRRLLANSARRAPAGSGVEARLRAADGFVEVAISDAGPVVAVDAQAVLFAPFSRAFDAMQADEEALGLAVAAAVAKAHGGAVTYQAKPGGNSTGGNIPGENIAGENIFTLSLPAAPTAPLTQARVGARGLPPGSPGR